MTSFAQVSLQFLMAVSFFTEGTQASKSAHVARAGTATTVAAAPSITPSPVLNFVDEEDIQPITCKSANILWFYSGPASQLNLYATNVGVSQAEPAPAPPTSSRANTFTNGRRAVPTGANSTPSITVPIVTSIDPSILTYTWPAVDVPQGWYILNASIPARSFTVVSDPIYVFNGADTSCLLPITTSSSSTKTSVPTTTAPPSTTSSSAASLPIGTTSSSNLGAIIGASVGAVALVAAILLAWLWLHRKGKKTNGGKEYPTRARRWNGLSSTDSRTAFGGFGSKDHSRGHQQQRTDSVGTILNTGSEEAVGAEKNSLSSKTDPFGDQGVALPVLNHHPIRTRSSAPGRASSASSSTLDAYATSDLVRPRRLSVSDSGRQSTDSAIYPPTSSSSHALARNSSQFGGFDMARSPSGSHHTSNLSHSTSSHSQPTTSPQPRYPNSPNPAADATKQANRQSLGKTKRKAVPTYNPDSVMASPISPSSTSPSPVPPPLSPEPFASSSVTSSSNGHYALRNQAGQDGSRPELVHKSSFGPGGVENKQLHYLIPDMPAGAKR